MRAYPGIPLLTIPDRATRNALNIIDTFLRDAARALSENQPAAEPSLGAAPNNATFLTLTNTTSLSAERRLTASSPIVLTDNGANTTAVLSLNLAALAGTPINTYATTEAAGTASTLIRTDATFQFPQALMPASGGTDTLTLTQSGVDQTLTGTASGAFNLRPGGETLSLPKWTAGGAGTAGAGTVLAFNAIGNVMGGAVLVAGIQAEAAVNESAATYTGDLYGGQFSIDTRTGPTYTGAQAYGVWARARATSSISGTQTFDRRAAVFADLVNPMGASGTTTDSMQIYGEDNTSTIGSVGTYINAYAANLIFPRTGTTIRRGYNLRTQATNRGTEATDTEGFYCETLQKGTTRRTGFAFDGATTGTPTDAYGFRQVTAHAVGTNRYGLNTLNAGVIQNPSGIGQNALTLDQLNTGATAGAHILFNDKAGDPSSLSAGQFWRNASKLKFYEGTLTHDLNPLTTKGDLIVHNGTTEVRQAVGTDTWVLTADSAQATGVKWAAAPGAGGGDSIQVNAVAVTDANFNNTTPAAVGSGLNVLWQRSGSGPDSVSAYVQEASLTQPGVVLVGTQTFGSGVKTGNYRVATGTNLDLNNESIIRGAVWVNRDAALAEPIWRWQGPAFSVNYLTSMAAVSGSHPYLTVDGTDANLNLNLVPKGTGKVQINGIEAVDISSAQTLTNKSVEDGTFFIIDNLDNTRKARFECSAISTGTTRSSTFMNVDGGYIAKTGVAPTQLAIGDAGGTYVVVTGLKETGGPTELTYGAIADGQFLKRSGTTVVGDTPGGSGITYTKFTKDLGTARRSGTFDITGLSGLTADRVVNIVQTADQVASKGNARDEGEMDQINVTGYVVDANTIRAYWQAPSTVVGTHAFAYAVSG